nr:hypothetical protein JVH1_8264 [Rhodococcus sp. JVH1]
MRRARSWTAPGLPRGRVPSMIEFSMSSAIWWNSGLPLSIIDARLVG